MRRLITFIRLVIETFRYVLVDDSHTLLLTRFGMYCLTYFERLVVAPSDAINITRETISTFLLAISENSNMHFFSMSS